MSLWLENAFSFTQVCLSLISLDENSEQLEVTHFGIFGVMTVCVLEINVLSMHLRTAV